MHSKVRFLVKVPAGDDPVGIEEGVVVKEV